MPELMERGTIDQLDTEHRDLLQLEVMKQMLGENPDVRIQLAWAKDFAEKVSDLIDYHEHDDIRGLALEGSYKEAAKRIIEILKH